MVSVFMHPRDNTLVDSPSPSPTATLGHQRGSSNASTMSGPFMYAADLRPRSNDDVVSLYLGDPEPDVSEARLSHIPVLRLIKHSGLVPEFRDRTAGVVKMLVEMSDLLFPPTYLLNEVIKKRVVTFTTYIIVFLGAVNDCLEKRIKQTREAFSLLPSPAVTDKESLALSIAKWFEILDSLHKPSGLEAEIFREISALYSTNIYSPLIQLHRIEPEHNMWQLEPELAAIALLFKRSTDLSYEADNFVRAIEEEFEMTMTHQPSTDIPDDVNFGVLGEKKPHHTPSKSAPVVVAEMSRPMVRNRENTL